MFGGAGMDVYFESFRDRDNRIHINKIQNKAFSFSAHFHSNIEIMYVQSGTLDVSIGGEKKVLTAGSVAVAESYVVHSLSADADSVIRVAIIPIIRIPDFSLAHRNLKFADVYLEPCEESRAIGQLFETYQDLSPQNSAMIGKGFAYILLGMLSDALGTVPADGHAKDGVAVVEQMLRYMDEHYTQRLTLEMIAVELGYHKDYLSRVFNETIQTGFSRYLSTMRLRYAVQLIRTTDLSLEEIADRSGFGNPHSFYDFFRENYHCTPGAYRKRIGTRMTVGTRNRQTPVQSQ